MVSIKVVNWIELSSVQCGKFSVSVSVQSGARKRHGSSVQGVACRAQGAGLRLHGIVYRVECSLCSVW